MLIGLIALAIGYVSVGVAMYSGDYNYRRQQYGTVRATVNSVCLVLAWPFMLLYAAYALFRFMTSKRGLF
ncbi:hypothetical protein HWB05_gp015 [Streptomyces phage BRock]|uniref:Uncharacterized protein n=1 Tax=Streptomyces phage BRock TaxID=1913591 RepID=A0A1J0GVS9_9CAUD|nr:hypothetical protein HWB05_gp015 [Streptomyces phage BRock]APC46277.1 hypothetical protein [Streptomyces phage BRock]